MAISLKSRMQKNRIKKSLFFNKNTKKGLHGDREKSNISDDPPLTMQ